MKICWNGRFQDAALPVFTVLNRCFRYGEGLFETIKVRDGAVLLWCYHLKRLQHGLALLEIESDHLNEAQIKNEITQLCWYNVCMDAGRVRISVYRNEHNQAGYIIEAAKLTKDVFEWNEQGWNAVVYPHGRKAMDHFANLKSSSYLLYTMAERYARSNGADEAIILNSSTSICEGNRTNLFIYKNDNLFTPSLSEGCVAGVMRQAILDYCLQNNIAFSECALTEKDVEQANELFITNAVQGIRWVAKFNNKQYGNTKTRILFEAIQATIYR